MSNESQRLELLRRLKSEGIIDVGRFQIISGEYLINNINQHNLLQKAFPNGQMDLLSEQLNSIFDKKKYYKISQENAIEDLMQFDIANEAVSYVIKYMDDFDNLINNLDI